MFEEWHQRSKNRSISKRFTVGIVAVLALLAARNVPPVFHHLNSHSCSIRAVSSHDQRPHFDFNGLQWSAPVRAFLPLPAVATASEVATSSQLFSSIQTKGFHYNRPPPAI
jgi:hypothetical protein